MHHRPDHRRTTDMSFNDTIITRADATVDD